MEYVKYMLFVAMVVLSCVGHTDEYVRGYYHSNGTYVEPHMRTSPDNTINNNYSTSPNVNPYTGRVGTIPQNPNQPQYNPYPTQNNYNNWNR